MPTYEFRCPNGHEFEKFYRKISDAGAEVPCPECGAVAARQLSAGAGLLFKGSGFYLTDYGKNAHRKAAPNAGDKSDAKADGKSETKSETKAESKAESKPEPTAAAKPEPKGGSTSGSKGE